MIFLVTLTLAKGHRSITIPSSILFILSLVWFSYKSLLSNTTGTDQVILIIIGFILFFNLQFFRDPLRKPDESSNESILAPADGVLFEIDTFSEKGTTIFRIRMRFWDVHVNYMPLNGFLLSCVKKRGSLLPILPFINKYSKNKNARQIMTFSSPLGFEFKVIQISGTLAYRTVAYGRKDQYFEKGNKIGMIRYGSETDLHIPTEYIESHQVLGKKVKAGRTIIAQLKK